MVSSESEAQSIPKKSVAFVLRKINDVAFEERPGVEEKELADNEVLVAPRKTGICGSDIHYVVHGRIGDFVVEKPMILGHESSGVVVRTGNNVTNLQKGDRVALEPGQVCRVCEACIGGRYELCPNMIFAATPPYDGTLQSFYTLPSEVCYKLPDNVTLEEGAMMEPLSVGVQAVAKIADVRAAQNVAVFGAGPVGLLAMATAKALGAARVIAIDIQEARLAFAKDYAATDIYVAGKPKEGEKNIDYSRRTAREISEELGIEERGRKGIDVVIDATGAETCIQTGIFLAKVGGTFVQVGMGSENVTIPITTVLTKQLQVRGSFRYGAGVYPLAIDLVSRGLIDLKTLVTHRFTFDEAEKAFQTTRAGKGEDGKPVIKAVIDGPK